MLWHIFKYYLGFVIAVFFKRTQISNVHNLKVKGPVILAMNHPNAFMDPVAISALVYPPRVRYLARGDAFKKGAATWVLESLGVIPIFRMQDGGKEGLLKNDDTYNIVNNLLKRNKKIIIFAEGICIQERRLRPLKKGVPRMIFGAMKDSDLKNLTVVPVGVNYQDPSQFRGTVFFNVGEPISINDYMEQYKEAPAKTMNVFLADLAAKMKSLIVNINYHRSEKVIEHLEIILKYDFFKSQNLNENNLEHDFLFSTKVVDVINKAEEIIPKKIIELTEKTSRYFSDLKKHQLKDWLINPDKQKRINYFVVILNIFFIILTLPIYVLGLLGNYVPYKLAYLITSKKVKIKEFKASFYMGIGAMLYLINYALLFFVPKVLYSGWLGLLIVIVSFISGYICLHLSPIRKKTLGMIRILFLKSKNEKKFNDLVCQRSEIIKMYLDLN
jgi:1-acyl-sn-glycerol-3-phosphate acyltransferase